MFSGHSLFIRSSIDSGQDYIGPIWSEAEIDSFLDDDVSNSTNPNLPTEMVEAAMYRLTGLDIDLAVQGAAMLNVSRDTGRSVSDQSHNTIAIEESEAVEREYDPSDPDFSLRPIVTPEDPNVAVGSLDMPVGKPNATKLDLIRMNARENPVEVALMDQLITCQCLYFLGAEIDDLINNIAVT
jgi:hypothetical protein